MRWSSAVSVAASLDAAVEEVAARVRADLDGRRPDLAAVFVSAHHRPEYEKVPRLMERQLGARVLVGCSAGGVIGGGHEVERQPAFSITAAILPDVGLHPFHLDSPRRPDVPSAARFLILPEPFTFDADTFLRALDGDFPGSTKIGGLASGGRQPGENALYVEDRAYRGGVVGVAFDGNIAVDTIVAQGCRPIGDPMFVTGHDRNVLRALDGRRPLDVLQELFQQSDARDREMFRHSLFLGLVMRERQERYRQGDFLIRNVIGSDPNTGALAIGALLEDHMIVQFHLRDAETSAGDLEELLARHQAGASANRPEGCLLFSCLGRGAALYGESDHDTAAFRRHFGPVPLGGFFCNGEIGPVQGTTFLHGYTSAFGLFRPLS